MNVKRRLSKLENQPSIELSKMTDEQLDEWGQETFGDDEWQRMDAEIKAMSDEELRALL